ncbi:hypothetical protein T35B1_17021 [Salinisphaera shabanensis T35B1]|uniref:metal-dependent hydrolase n=1 Tax=Salinisphaera TaxID=180541 RepID=UPI0033415A15
MTKWGHLLTSTGFGILGYRALVGANPELSVVQTLDWFAAAGARGDLSNAPQTAFAMACAGGVIAGSLAPDRMEFPLFGRLFGRVSLIPHRTLTHSPWLWVAFLFAGLVAIRQTHAWGLLFAWQWVGFSASGLLHLIIDMGSMSGIPLANPFGQRYSLSLYQTGGLREVGYAVAIGGGTGLLGWFF